MDQQYPPSGFHFLVQFDLGLGNTNDVRFQSVSGISQEMEYEEIKEGGLLLHTHKLPVRTKTTDLILKRGLYIGSALKLWFDNAFVNFIFLPANLQVILLNEEHEPLKTWSVSHVLPKKLEVSSFNAEKSELVIETLTLSYNSLKES